ncbi:hypothetical protein [Caldilinea sp.]|uniref:hypothetical protein n=1 Tax=Caldilinea sp. TaxID=2293560 RepID=UPI002C539447|nr:hypothetical protein [Anaerolineales bacterium]HQY94939.1 hypothetical protein [Caldilinea sp.]
MTETLRIFVGVTLDLEAERGVIGKAIAELPVQTPIEIRRTPPLLPTHEEIFERIANCDRVYFLLGNDITAPAGLEWETAWRLERAVLPLRRSPRPTPAAQEFQRFSPRPWLDFRSATELARIVSLDVARLLQHPINRYGLTVPELERLEIYIRRLDQLQATLDKEPSGAEGGGVLLDSRPRSDK